MLYSPEDRAIHEALLSRSRVRPEQLFRLSSALAAWAKEDKVPSVDGLGLSGELGSRTATALLSLLEEAELVKWDPESVHVVVPIEEFEPRARLLAGQFETLRTQDARRLDAVAEYADGAACRAWFLREYFGEEDGEACGMCDRCRGQADRPNSFWEPLAPPRGEERRRGRGRSRNPRGRQPQQQGRRPHPQHAGGQAGDGQQFGARRNNRRRRRRGRNRDGQRFEGGARPEGQGFQPDGANLESRPDAQTGGPAQYERISMDDIAAEAHGAGTALGARPDGDAGRQNGPGGGQGGSRRRRRGRRRGGRGRRWREHGEGPQQGGAEGGGGERGPGGAPDSSGPAGEG
jgi:hypothetical protein